GPSSGGRDRGRRDRRSGRGERHRPDRAHRPSGGPRRIASRGEPCGHGDTDRGRDSGGVSHRSGGAVKLFLIADVRGYTSFTERKGDEAAGRLVSTFAS